MAGTAFVATDVPGLSRYFKPGIHFEAYESLEECADIVQRLCEDHAQRRTIAEAGHRKASDLVHSHIFWVMVDSGLGQDSMTQ